MRSPVRPRTGKARTRTAARTRRTSPRDGRGRCLDLVAGVHPRARAADHVGQVAEAVAAQEAGRGAGAIPARADDRGGPGRVEAVEVLLQAVEGPAGRAGHVPGRVLARPAHD